jgi:hypothetical protein
MPDHRDLNPDRLKPGLAKGGRLKPGLVTPAYTGGTPGAAGQIKPSLRDRNGNLKPGLVQGNVLKPSLRNLNSAIWTPDSIDDANLLQNLGEQLVYAESLVGGLPVLASSIGTLAPPRGQRCVRFDGNNDFATRSRVTSGTITQLTVCGWYKTSTGSRALAAEYATGGNFSWLLYHFGGQIWLNLSGNGTSVGFYNSNAGTYTNGSWRHVAFTFNAGLVVLYVDGVAVAGTADAIPPSLFNTTAAFNLGGNIAGVLTLDGWMVDWRVYNEALSPSRVLAITNQHLTPSVIDSTGLVAAWWLQDEGGTTIRDWSGNGRDLIATNTQSTFHATDAGVKYNAANELGHSLWKSIDSNGSGAAYAENSTWISIRQLTGDFSYKFLLRVNGGNGVIGVQQEPVPDPVGYNIVDLGVQFIDAANVRVWSNGAYSDHAFAWTSLTQMVISRSVSTLSLHLNGTLIKSVTINTNPMYPVATLSTVFNLIAHVPESDIQSRTASVHIVYGNLVIPRNEADTSKDVLGNTLQYAGPIAQPPAMEVPCVTGNGSSVRISMGTQQVATGNTPFKKECLVNFSNAASGLEVLFWEGSDAINRCHIVYRNGSGKIVSEFGSGTAAATSATTIVAGKWYRVTVEYTGAANVVSIDGVVEATTSYNAFNLLPLNSALLAYYSATSVWALHATAGICGVSITTGGVTRYPLFDQCGPGSSNTNRDFYIMGSDGSATLVSGGIVNGTVSEVYATRCPFVRDWAIQYGGGIAANGSFIPGRIGSNLDAAGNAKTLLPGQHRNPFSRLIRNPFGAPSLAINGATPTTRLAPGDDDQAVSPANTKFTSGYDRYFATRVPLVGSELSSAEDYRS